MLLEALLARGKQAAAVRETSILNQSFAEVTLKRRRHAKLWF